MKRLLAGFASILLLGAALPADAQGTARDRAIKRCNDNRGTDCKTDEQPAHLVKITKAFDIGKYEVTQAQWTSVMGSNPSTMKDDHRPVETVTKPEVERFLALLNERHDGYRYRLPTESEWEYAAGKADFWNATYKAGKLKNYAVYDTDKTEPVGEPRQAKSD